MSIDEAIRDATRNIPDCVAAGVIDLRSGTLVGSRRAEAGELDLVAAAASGLFGVNGDVTASSVFEAGWEQDEDPYREIIVSSEDRVHVLTRLARDADLAFVAVCRLTTNLGMILARSRMELPKVEATI